MEESPPQPNRLTVRQLTVHDYDAVRALQLQCFPKMKPWNHAQWESMVGTFPEGQIGVEIDGEVVASSASLIVDYSEYAAWHDWLTVADGGYIRNHDPEGDTLYGIEIQVSPRFRSMKLARRLYDARKSLCRRRNLHRIVVGGRIPGYAAHRGELSAQEYVGRVIRKKLYDPVLTTQIANGFVVEQIIPEYMPSDEDSAGFATCLEWYNLDYISPASPRGRRSYDPVRVATVQYKMRPVESFEDFAKQVEFMVDTASDAKANFICFPELFTLQLLSLVKPDRPGRAARELATFTPRFLDLMRGLAMRFDIHIVGGSQFQLDGDVLKNSAYLFRGDGTMERQDKIHVTPNEARWWGVTGGDAVHVFDTSHGKVAIAVCYDVEFPELCRVLVERGALLLFVPFNTNDRHGHIRVRTCAQARCIENQIYVVTSGCVGNLPGVENADIHYAQSGIFTPSDIPFSRDGIAAEAQPNEETVLIHDLDLQLLRRARRAGTVRNWADRRPDLYRVSWGAQDAGPGAKAAQADASQVPMSEVPGSKHPSTG
jgi:predicted amidohydrolase/GNAT superfamily N-acetyltransferase